MVELNWTYEAEQWLHDIYDYISKENPDAALQTIESIFPTIYVSCFMTTIASLI